MRMLAPLPHSSREPTGLAGVAEAEARHKGHGPTSTSARPGPNKQDIIPSGKQAGKSPLPWCWGGGGRERRGGRSPKNNRRMKGSGFNREKKQQQHFPPADLCDSITLSIPSPEQARLPSNRRSQPLMRLARGQPGLPASLIARLKSLYLIGPEIQKGMITRGCLSGKKQQQKTTNWFF